MPVEIADWNDLDNVRNDLTGDYVLVNDLDENTSGYDSVASPTANDGQGFDPIGNEEFGEEVFTGSFDGQGNAIYDLTIDRSGRRLIAMFAKATNIQNLNVLDANINVDHEDNTHAILAASSPSTSEPEMNLENCTVSGSITVVGGGERVGGLVGQLFDAETDAGTIQNCVSHVDVTSVGDEVGGLVGRNGDTVTESYATGSVEGTDGVGGLVGQNQETVTESYATGSVEGTDEVGGLVGNSFGTETDSYWDTEATGQSTSDGDGTGLTTAEMQGSEAETNMDGFDFANTWDSVLESDDDTTADGYPILSVVDREQQLDSQGVSTLIAFTISALVNSESVEIQNIFAQVNDEVREVTEAFALINGSVEQI